MLWFGVVFFSSALDKATPIKLDIPVFSALSTVEGSGDHLVTCRCDSTTWTLNAVLGISNLLVFLHVSSHASESGLSQMRNVIVLSIGAGTVFQNKENQKCLK